MKLINTSVRVLKVVYDFVQSGATEYLGHAPSSEDIVKKLGAEQDSVEDIHAAIHFLDQKGFLRFEPGSIDKHDAVMLTESGQRCVEQDYSELYKTAP